VGTTTVQANASRCRDPALPTPTALRPPAHRRVGRGTRITLGLIPTPETTASRLWPPAVHLAVVLL
jgi:hypothetical protein